MKPPILYGLHIGEHGFEPATIIEEVKKNCLPRGMNFVTLRVQNSAPIDPAYFLQWAEFFAENKVYFIFLYSIQYAPAGCRSQLNPALVSRIREIAGEYYLGDMLGELGSVYAGKLPGYYIDDHAPMLPQGEQDVRVAKAHYLNAVRGLMDTERWLGMDGIGVMAVEATTLSTYNLEAGVTIPAAELMGQDPEVVVASARGAARAHNAPMWGTYIAHEWYAGHYHDDLLKRRRLELEYKYAYMSGSHMICHESGDDVLSAHGREHPADSEISRECRDFIDRFGRYIACDQRPEGEPLRRVAFLQGDCDAWAGRMRNSPWIGTYVWGQYAEEKWAYNTPEWSWSILQELSQKRAWWEFDSYACHGADHSGTPPYGSYDILPISAPVSVLNSYDTLIFCGWNSMTEQQLCKLEQFVEQGGTLLIGAAHLNTSTAREGERSFVRNGDLSRLLGCKLTGKTFSCGYGMKFRAESCVDGVQYPRALYPYNDPLYALGSAEYAEVTLCGGRAVATLEDGFAGFDAPGHPALIEHCLGRGRTLFLCAADYPGHNAVYPLYRSLVLELLRAGTARAAVRVIAPASVRFTTYADGSVYLLNTDFDCPAAVTVAGEGYTSSHTLAPLELLRVKTGIRVAKSEGEL